MKKINVKEREVLIKRVMNQIENNYEHHKAFILNCVKDQVEYWKDEDLLDFLGEKWKTGFVNVVL